MLLPPAPATEAGRAIEEFLRRLGPFLWLVLAGILTSEYARLSQHRWWQGRRIWARCARCTTVEHAPDARFCKRCGSRLAGKARAPDAA